MKLLAAVTRRASSTSSVVEINGGDCHAFTLASVVRSRIDMDHHCLAAGTEDEPTLNANPPSAAGLPLRGEGSAIADVGDDAGGEGRVDRERLLRVDAVELRPRGLRPHLGVIVLPRH